MATPVNFSPPQPYMPAQSSAASTPQGGETALVLNINSPLINHQGNSPSGNANGSNGGACAQGPVNDVFQRKSNPAYTPNPNANPAQQLQDAYANALTVRNDAEQARTNFLNMAGQLENQALSKFGPAANNPFAQSTQPMQPATPAPPYTFQAPPPAAQPAPPAPQAAPQPDPSQQFQQQLQNLQQQQPAAPAAPQPQAPAYDPAAQQQQLQQQQMMQQQQSQIDALKQQLAQQQQPQQPQQPQMDPMQQQQLMQQQMMQQQQAQQQAQMDPMQQQMLQQQQAQQQGQMDPMQQQMMQQQMMQQAQQQQQGGYAGAGVADLNTMIAQPRTPDEKLMAINEIANRQQGDRQTYELLKQEVSNPMQGVPPEAATAIRQAALIALGSLNGSPVNGKLATNQLYGMDAINQIIGNKNENPLVKASAVASLGYMNRPQDKAIQMMLAKASKDKNPDVQNAVAQVQQGQMISPAQAGMDPQMGLPQQAPAA